MKRLRAATFALPGAIALLASAGLFAALLGDGAWDALAWLGLGLIALLGGWPGALCAQSLLRHKNRKVSFQQVFWICVVANAACTMALLRAFG